MAEVMSRKNMNLLIGLLAILLAVWFIRYSAPGMFSGGMSLWFIVLLIIIIALLFM